MGPDQLLQRLVGGDVPLGDNYHLQSWGEKGQALLEGTAPAQWLLLNNIVERHPQGLPIPKILLDYLMLVATEDMGCGHAPPLKPAEMVMEEGVPIDEPHRFGAVFGERSEPFTPPPRKDK